MVHQTSQGSAANWQERETLWYLGGQRIIQALELPTQQTSIIFEYLVPARTSVYSYGPSQEDTAFYVLAGEATFISGETTIQAAPGTFLFLPRPVGFHYVVSSSSHVRLLTWTTPLGFAQRVTSMGNQGETFVLSPPSTYESEKVQHLATLLRAYLGIG
jgi:hypothetical protein